MASISGTSSLGNTSLRGFGGMASGIDRDEMIEQMTLGTTTKIANQKKEITSIGWKQEAYRNITDKILDLQDNYFSYASGNNLKDPDFFGKNLVSALGDSKVTKYVTATGSSNMLDYIALKAVNQLATAATLTSGAKQTAGAIPTGITADKLNTDGSCRTSNLEGRQLTFAISGTEGKFLKSVSFQFPSTYKEKDKDGNEVTKSVDYTMDLSDPDNQVELCRQLDLALEQSNIKLGDDKISDVFGFGFKNGSIQLNQKKDTDFVIRDTSSALEALGYSVGSADGKDDDTSGGISIEYFNNHTSDFEQHSVRRQTMAEYMTGKKLNISFAGQTKEIELVKEGETFADMDEFAEALNKRLSTAFGKDNVKAEVNSEGALEFKLGSNADPNQTLTVNSTNKEVREMLGIGAGASNKVSLESSLADNWEKLGFSSKEDCENQLKDGLEINGVKINVTSESTVNELINKINSNKEVGVKAQYISASNQFVLVASETGKGREIDVGTSGAAYTIFSGPDGKSEDGKNARIEVNYGNGFSTEIESSSNTFNLEGLKVTVSGTFGYDAAGNADPSQAVTFSAKADADSTAERVKKFIEEYNAIVSEVNTQVTTKSDSSYGPLTDEQKEEMSETSIENWEKKAKQGLLFNDPTMRQLSMDLQGVLVNLLNSGVKYNDLEEIGITMSDDVYDGGRLTFDEAKFKSAMSSDPDKVSRIICGGEGVSKGLIGNIEDTLNRYATRYSYKNGGSNGLLVEVAGTEKLSRSVTNNQIYKQLEEMQKSLEKLQSALLTEQDRYISQFATMESLISQMNAQSSYLSGLS